MILSAIGGSVSASGSAASPSGSAVPAAASHAPTGSGSLVQVSAASHFTPDSASGPGTTTVVPVPTSNPASALLTVDVNLKPSGDLSGFVDQVSNPASPYYRVFLTAPEVSSDFGADPATYAAAVSYFEGFGLTVTPGLANFALSVTGTGAEIESAFHTQLGAYREQYTSDGNWIPTFGNGSGVAGSVTNGPVFYANSLPAELPSSLEQSVAGVVGLNGLYAEPSVTLPTGLYPGFAQKSGAVAPTVKPKLTLDSIQSLQGANYTWANLAPTYLCADYGDCYDYQFLYPSTMHVLTGAENLWDGAATIGGMPDTGQGVTVAVIEAGCAIPSDLETFSQEVFGSSSQLMDRLTQIAINDPSAIVPNTNLSNCIQNGELWGWTGETELDIEYIAAMAPSAHIDVIGDPSAAWITNPFDYVQIATYLTTGAPCDLAGMASDGILIVEGTAQAACSITVTSNSYQIGEQWAYFLAAPEYITVEDEDLEILNAEGVTNFFASGDDGSNGAAIPGSSAASAGAPSASPGGTAVGGGQVTAAGPNGKAFPSGPVVYDPYDLINQTVVHAKSVASFTYWSCCSRSPALGAGGGGFGVSIVESQPWWENALDTYSTGAEVNPIVSGAANFNMSSYSFGGWELFYGGTSFATPITAGEWVLIEEQANVALGSPRMGDVNPALFAAHNAWEAGVPLAAHDPYVPMSNIGVGDGDYAPDNSYSWYYFNLSVNEPSDPVLPLWYPTLENPAGSGWNFLQGLGMPSVTVLDNELLGVSLATQHGLLDQPFSVREVEGGSLVPITTLAGGTTFILEVVTPSGAAAPGITVEAYSGGANTGQYGGGTVATFQTNAAGQFSYTPTYVTPALPTDASEYGYFYVAPGSSDWSFQPYAVGAPPASGYLSLCVTDVYGICQPSDAEVPMFATVTTFPNGSYNLFGSSTVELNGVPVANAVVSQTVLESQTGLFNPYLPPSSYAPGSVIGHTISDARGNALFWTAPEGLAELNGTVAAEVFSLQATYDGLTSNPVTVFVEPQSGSTDTNLHFWGSTLSGTVLLSDLKYVDFLNVSIGSAPGQFENFSCPVPGAFLGVSDGFSQPAGTVPFPGGVCRPFFDSNPNASYQYPTGVWHSGIWESGILNDLVPISLSAHGLNWWKPVVFSLLAGGTNDLTFTSCTASGCSVTPSIQYPMYWSDPLVIAPSGASTGSTSWDFFGSVPLTLGLVGVAAVAGVVAGYFVGRHRRPRGPESGP